MFQIGKRIKFTLFGKSHGPFVGCILEGVPQGITLNTGLIELEMNLRKPKKGIGTSRIEDDIVEFLSGVDDSITDGSPILIRIANMNVDKSKYIKFYNTPRPGHADLPAILKFIGSNTSGLSIFSGRLTAAIVAAGSIAKQFISKYHIQILAFTKSIGKIYDIKKRTQKDALSSRGFTTRACTKDIDDEMILYLKSINNRRDSVGGIVECLITGLPIGFGGVWFQSLDAELAKAMFGIPACKGIEFGDGFMLSKMYGSESNDGYRMSNGKIVTETNHMGGIVGGMCDGAPVVFRVAFKATPSIGLKQNTINLKTNSDDEIEVDGRYDTCIVPRAVSVVEAMAALTIADWIVIEGYNGHREYQR